MNTNALVFKKIGMSRMVDAQGDMVPVTLLKLEDQQITKICTKEKEGYTAVQIGYFAKPEARLPKSDLSRLKKANVSKLFTRFKEFRLDAIPESYTVGQIADLSLLNDVAAVDVTGLTKGRGFEGVMRRYGYHGGRAAHGSMFHRQPGSLGCRTTPGRVFKNKKMPGHYGVEQRTIANLRLLDVDHENLVIAVGGSVPGMKNTFLYVKPAYKLLKKAAKKAKQA